MDPHQIKVINIDNDTNSSKKNNEVSFIGSVLSVPINAGDISGRISGENEIIEASRDINPFSYRSKYLTSSIIKNESKIKESIISYNRINDKEKKISKSVNGNKTFKINSINDVVLNKNINSLEPKNLNNPLSENCFKEYSFSFHGDFEMESPNVNNPNNEAIVVELDVIELSFLCVMNYGFLEGPNCVEVEGENRDIFLEIQHFANIFHDLLEFSRKIQNQYKKILKPLNFKTFLVFAFLKQININTINNENELIENFKSICGYEKLEKMISKYLVKILSDFYSTIFSGANSSDANKNYLYYFSKKGEEFSQKLKGLLLLQQFSIGNDIEKIKNNILKFFFISISKDILSSFSKEITNFSLFKSMVNHNIFDEGLKESTTDKLIANNKLNYSQSQMIFFYVLLFKINDYYKNTFLSCCGMKNTDDINYSKSPYVFCFDCHLLVCIKCFKEHRNHHYFDFACTIKQKIGNIHSNPTKFINYSNTSSNKDMFVEDFIMNNILNGFSCSRFLNLITGNKEKGFKYTIFDFLDIILLEYLYKEIYPFLDDDKNVYLNYFISELKGSSNFFEIILKEILKETDQDLYERIVKEFQEENLNNFKNECINKIKGTVDFGFFHKFSNINNINLNKIYKITNEKKEIFDDKKFIMEKEYREWTKCEDLDIPIEKYQQYLEFSKNENDKDKKCRTSFPDMNKKFLFGKNTSTLLPSSSRDIISIESFIEHGIRNKLDLSSYYIKAKWYKIIYDKKQFHYRYKYLDGFGPLYEYAMFFIENILNEISNFGSTLIDFNNLEGKNELI